MIAGLVSSGDIAIFIVVLTIFEVVGLVFLRRRSGRGPRLRAFLPSLLAGDCLLLAWFADMSGYDWHVVAGALLGGLAAHVVDLGLRWRG
jgi:hypothetical protein